jgi:hypothetical protein
VLNEEERKNQEEKKMKKKIAIAETDLLEAEIGLRINQPIKPDERMILGGTD